jgi:uncharacterized OB-fold protein/acyl dehydratase
MTIDERLQAFVGRESGAAAVAPDPVNEAMIRHWCAALDDRNPVYTDPVAAGVSVHGGVIAPPTMLQAWVMAPGPHERHSPSGRAPQASGGRQPAEGNPQTELLSLLDEAGYTSVVATDCEQDYVRMLRPGDRLTLRTSIDAVSPLKSTALGEGHFVTTRQSYYDAAGELVGTMKFRLLKFRPRATTEPEAPRPRRPRPAVTQDIEFWFDAAREHRLVIQRCADCGTLRHPPRPMCPECRSARWDTVDASGRGTIYSFVVTHYPQVGAFDYPLPIVLVELDEGTRLVSNLVGCEPDELAIGAPVEVTFVDFDPELTLPQFRLVPSGGGSRPTMDTASRRTDA